MQKVLNNRVLLAGLVTFFFLLSFVFAHAAIHVEDTSTVSNPNSDEQTNSNQKALKRDRPLKPSSLPTRAKAIFQKVRGNRGATNAADVDNGDENSNSDSDIRQKPGNENPKADKVRSNLKYEREDLKTKRDERKLDRKEKRAELSTKRIERIKAYVERIIRRFNTAIERLEKLADRVDSRIEKLEGRGLDLSTASTLVDEARREIKNVKVVVAGVLSETETALETDNPKIAFQRVKEILSGAKQDIKDAHKKLVEAIRAVKASVSNDQ